MKLLPGCLALTLALAACGGGSDDNKPSAGNSTTTQKTVETTTTNAATPTPTTMPTATPTPATVSGERPVDFTYTGVTPDKESIAYKIKVNTAKKVTQVDLGIKYMDAGGAVVEETTYAWQNIVKSVRKPIEKGQTYQILDPLPDGATRAEVTLKRVIFEDGTRWEAGQ